MNLNLILLIFPIGFIIFLLLEINTPKKGYKYNFRAKILDIKCEKYGSTSSSIKTRSQDFSLEARDTYNYDNIKCKLKLQYNTNDLGYNNGNKIFYITMRTNEPFIIGEYLNFVSNSSREADFMLCCPLEIGIYGIISQIFLILTISISVSMNKNKLHRKVTELPRKL